MINIFKEGAERIGSVFKKWVDEVNEFDNAINKMKSRTNEESWSPTTIIGVDIAKPNLNNNEDTKDKIKEVKYWSYNVVDEKARVYFDKQQRCIDISEETLKDMLDWIEMAKHNYYRDSEVKE